MMSKFFNLKTGTLHFVESYAGAVKLPKDISQESIRINERILDNDGYPLMAPKLRRQNANQLRVFFSRESNTLLNGSYDLADRSNRDLTEVANIISYR
ncbi:TPA: peptidase [Legionella pneumophila]|nr:peptidase [Legionella pneumophila]